ncbi:SRPBCC family protein [Deinococcus arenicola]|uniref:Cyclase n=1 Tax=Deinococcus arenicola TaxID=2994950 RepID=A0ABU4DW99_9DEIO|nr:SRPBCC family protein [Deinococcus sp. ZS9-10]MDV6376207.1 cyclase [Deinococcus sp. ZS9-10]
MTSSSFSGGRSVTPSDRQSTGAMMPGAERAIFGVVGVFLLTAGLCSGSPFHRLAVAALGVGLSALALSGRSPVATALKIQQNEDGETLVSDAVTIGKGADELYAVWRKLENLPHLMKHLERVEVLDERLSRWTVKAPFGYSGGEVSWEAELTADEPGQRIAWQSLPGAQIENSGAVLFRAAPGDRGTEVVVRLTYRPPLGSAGTLVARIAGQEPSQQLRDDLMRFKREQELGYHPTTKGQSSGRAEKGDKV